MTDAGDAGEQLLLRRYRFELIHHALLAMTIAAVTLALDATRSFADLDTEMRSFIMRLRAERQVELRQQHAKKGFHSQFDIDAAEDRALVFDIPAPPEAAAYRRQSLHQFYAELIRALADKRPKLLAVHLPLDPGIDDWRLNDPRFDPERLREQMTPPRWSLLSPPNSSPPSLTREELEELQRTVAYMENASGDRRRLDDAIEQAAKLTPLVLMAPPLPVTELSYQQFRVDARETERVLFERQIAWMRRMCAIPNVSLALSYTIENTILSQYNRGWLSLGNVVTSALNSRQEAGTTSSPKSAQAASAVSSAVVCDIVRDFESRTQGGDSSSRQLDRRVADPYERLIGRLARIAPSDARRHYAAFNPEFFETLSYLAIFNFRLGPPDTPIASLLPPRLTQKVLFLGDSLPPVRVLLDAPISAAEMHSAILYSNQHAIGTLSHTLVFLIDVAIGTVLGFLFTWSWGIYVRASDRMVQIPLEQHRAKVAAWAWVRLVLLPANLLLLVGLVAATWWFSNVLLRVGSWINPLPLVFGMSLKGLLSSRQRNADHAHRSFKELLARHPDIAWQPFAIVAALAIYAFSH